VEFSADDSAPVPTPGPPRTPKLPRSSRPNTLGKNRLWRPRVVLGFVRGTRCHEHVRSPHPCSRNVGFGAGSWVRSAPRPWVGAPSRARPPRAIAGGSGGSAGAGAPAREAPPGPLSAPALRTALPSISRRARRTTATTPGVAARHGRRSGGVIPGHLARPSGDRPRPTGLLRDRGAAPPGSDPTSPHTRSRAPRRRTRPRGGRPADRPTTCGTAMGHPVASTPSVLSSGRHPAFTVFLVFSSGFRLAIRGWPGRRRASGWRQPPEDAEWVRPSRFAARVAGPRWSALVSAPQPAAGAALPRADYAGTMMIAACASPILIFMRGSAGGIRRAEPGSGSGRLGHRFAEERGSPAAGRQAGAGSPG